MINTKKAVQSKYNKVDALKAERKHLSECGNYSRDVRQLTVTKVWLMAEAGVLFGSGACKQDSLGFGPRPRILIVTSVP